MSTRVIDPMYLLTVAAVWVPCLAPAGASYALVLHPQMDERRELDVKISAAKEHYVRAAAAARPKTEHVGEKPVLVEKPQGD